MSQVRTARLFEERIAGKTGGEHVRRSSYGQTAPDIYHPFIVGECKLRKTLALESWMSQVETHREDGKVCAVFAKQKGLRDDRTIVCVRLPDFLKLMCNAGGEHGKAGAKGHGGRDR